MVKWFEFKYSNLQIYDIPIQKHLNCLSLTYGLSSVQFAIMIIYYIHMQQG